MRNMHREDHMVVEMAMHRLTDRLAMLAVETGLL